MRDDLLDVHACVEWAESQFDILNGRIAAWRDRRPYAAIRQENPQSGKDAWELREVEPIPRIINAETGIIIHSLRSALDLLANRLAERNGHVGKKDTYFPIYIRQADFEGTGTGRGGRRHSGREKIKWLSTAHQAAIESLQPYHGGDFPTLLWSLHDLDTTRKHRTLVQTHSSPHGIGVYKLGSLSPDLDQLMREQPPDNGYVLPREPTDPDHRIQIRIEVSLAHVGIGGADPLIWSLQQFAYATEQVIALFDTP